jgi:CRP/FNR family transcriptional regulator, anaerobic regulatory protein
VTAREQANQLLLTSLTRFISLTDDECKNVVRLFQPLRLDKREHWFQAGTVCTEIAFVVSGCIRTCYTKNDVERTGQFFFENSWYTDYESWLTKQPTQVSVEALERTELLLIPFYELERLYEQNPKWERVGRLMAENVIIRIRNRNLSLLNDSPEERYLQLIKERPKVINRVPQHIIASFLGIEPETLSRIRKKLSVKGEPV